MKTSQRLIIGFAGIALLLAVGCEKEKSAAELGKTHHPGKMAAATGHAEHAKMAASDQHAGHEEMAKPSVAGDPHTGEQMAVAEGSGPTPTPSPQTHCPVMGGKINKELFADSDGKRVYFCCAGCSGKFVRNPGGYIKKLEGQGVALATVPEASPAAPRRQRLGGGCCPH